MAERIKTLKGMIVLSGYQCPLYKELFEDDKWVRFDKEAHADGAKDRIESLWLNAAAIRGLNTLFQ